VAWEPPVLGVVASQGEGVEALAAALDQHHRWLEGSGQLAERRRRRLAARTRAVLERGVRRWLAEATRAEELLASRLDEVAAGRRSPYEVASEILDHLRAEAAP
jgi:LAO/AO transport system kinase